MQSYHVQSEVDVYDPYDGPLKPQAGPPFTTTTFERKDHDTDTRSQRQRLTVSAVETKADPTFNVQPTLPPPRSDCSSSSTQGAKSPGLSTPGLAPPPSLVSQLFYESVRNLQPPVSCPTPSSTGATRGANSSADTRDELTPPLTPMSAPRDARGADTPRSPAPDDPVNPAQASRSPARQAGSSASHQRSFQRQSFPSLPFYPALSEQAYATPAAYPHRPAPGPAFMGQYMSSQPLHSMQAPVPFTYSQSFAHPGIHAHDPSGIGPGFSPLPPGFSYQPVPSSDDHDVRSAQGYVPAPASPFAPSPGTSQPSSTSLTSNQHMSHHAYAPFHYPPATSAAHYHSYPAHSYAHPTPGLYSFAPSPYPQSFYGQPPPSPDDPNKGGIWWYLPSGGQQYDPPPYPGAYAVQGYPPSMQINRPEFDPYAAQAPLGSSSLVTGPSGQQQQQPAIHMPPHDCTFPPPSPVAPRAGPSNIVVHAPVPRDVAPSPTLLKKRSPAGTASASPPAASRKSYHPNPPANRSEWVMWVGNVPSDATHDELWRFFNQPAPVIPLPPGTSAVMSSRHIQPPPFPGEQDMWSGVSSVFLISRSNCAFVNFETENHLESAVLHFNGKPIRPKDPRCPRLVCRVRRRDDDLKAGVGGQRGMGLHTRWVAEQKERGEGRERERELKAMQNETGEGNSEGEGEVTEEERYNVDGPPTSPSIYLAPSSSSDPSPPIPAVSPLDDPPPAAISSARCSPEARELPRHGSSGDRSFASTNSSFLAANFPKRYFILKSLTQFDLNLSLERGVWATQPHNEGILDQAYRTSSDVFLIFGANKSGEFYGYARMAGPIFHSERVDHVTWQSRPSVPPAPGHRGSTPPEVIKEEEEEDDRGFLSPGESRMVGESPAPITPGQEARLKSLKVVTSPVDAPKDEFVSAPAEPHQPHHRLSRPALPREAETYPERPSKPVAQLRAFKAASDGPQFALNLPPLRTADTKADTSDQAGSSLASSKDTDGVVRLDTYGSEPELRRQRAKEAAASPTSPRAPIMELEFQQNPDDRPEDKLEGWGREFKIEWLCTQRLPFNRTRNLRNPWNHDREVKVSRDGTELEPGVGQKLLDEWDKPLAPLESSPTTSPTRARGSRPPPARATGGTSGALPASIPSFSSQMHRVGAGSGSGGGFSGVGRGRNAGQM